MEELKYIFMGTPQFSVGILEGLLKTQHQLLAVVTTPDKPAGRGLKNLSSDVKKFSTALDVPILEPFDLKDPSFANQIQQLNPDLIFVVAFKFLPKVIWQIPKLGTINLHTSLLPDYRGAAPINWAIINGEKKTGITTFLINEKIDEGAILFQEKISIDEQETAGSLHDKMMEIGKEISILTLNSMAKGEIHAKKQIENSKKLAPKIFTQDCEVFWDLPSREIYNKIRGLSPYPAAFCFLMKNNNKIKIKILKSSWISAENNIQKPKLEYDKQGLKIILPDGILTLDEIQPEGKKIMKAQDFVNGLQKDDKLELVVLPKNAK